MLNAPGDSEYRVDGVAESAYCGTGRGKISVGPISSSYSPFPKISTSGPERARMVEDGGKEIPRTVSEKGSLSPPGMPSIGRLSSWDDIESSLTCEACRLLATPTLVCFLLSTFERGLSMVDADDPEARDGVRVLGGTSSLGKRDVEVCGVVFELVMLGC